MRKIAHVRELVGLTDLPVEVVDVIRDAVTILDAEYGEDREVDRGDGGYVLVIDNEGEIELLKERNIDLETVIPEYVDVVTCDCGKIFISCLCLFASDFGVLAIMSSILVPENLKGYISDCGLSKIVQ